MQRNGIHHVTAIAGPARRNIEFYTRTLGLRLVKKTVNFDDPGTYHLYYGDEQGSRARYLPSFHGTTRSPGAMAMASPKRPRSAFLRNPSDTGRTALSRRVCRTRPWTNASANRCFRSPIRTA